MSARSPATELAAVEELRPEFEAAGARLVAASTDSVQALQTGELCPANWRPGQATLEAA